jgi:pullulanase
MKIFNNFFLLVLSFFLTISCSENTSDKGVETLNYIDVPTYASDDLGVEYANGETSVKLWSPKADSVVFLIFDVSIGGQPLDYFNLKKENNGVWSTEIQKDIKNLYYSFKVKFNDKWMSPEVDPYAKAVGVNGKRGMIVDLNETNPESWNDYQRPELKSFKDIILYELHVRDLSIASNSGIKNKGKFLGLTETGSKIGDYSTGIDHIKEMGVTHVHLLPSFDFRSIDETKLDENKYNWGYDPQNYNTPEGSYSTNPYDGRVRIREFKEMIMAFHKAGIRVVMDVVYNHTGYTSESNFEQLVPGYFYRTWDDGSFSNSSGCGNETASEREMFRKFMVQSVLFWAEEYHIDGFRFDLMGIHDIETMNLISAELSKLDSSIFIYGEGWTAGDSPLPFEKRAVKANASQLDRIAVFSDDIRDGIKGSWNSEHSKGYVSGNLQNREDVKFGVVASTNHPQLDYEKVSISDCSYSNSPLQTISYVSCHDNHTLFDKLQVSNPGADLQELKRLHKLSNAMVFLSQGVPFLHAGVEMLRTKQGVENSFESPDSINQIDWQWKVDNIEHVEFYKNLIKLRKAHPALKFETVEQINANLKFLEIDDQEVLAYQINGREVDDAWKDIIVIFNVSKGSKEFVLESKGWNYGMNASEFYLESGKSVNVDKISVEGQSAVVLYKS